MLTKYRSKLNLHLVVSLLILLQTFYKPIWSKKIEWFAYCYFEIDSNFTIDTLSCGKCIDIYEENLDKGDDRHMSAFGRQLRFRRELVEVEINNTYLNLTSSDDTNFTTQILPIAKKAVNLKVAQQLKDDFDYCSYFEKHSNLNKHEHDIKHFYEKEIYVIPLIPVLTLDWYHFDLLYLIEKNEISTNLENLTFFSQIPFSLKTIELINFGIESINYNAFKKFPNLKVIRLRKNNLNTVELSSFLTSDDESNGDDDENDYNDYNGDEENFDSHSSEFSDDDETRSAKRVSNTRKSKLIELDLSSNKLFNIKLENFIYLENLKSLNLSNNMIRHFDLHFLSVVTPHLQILDLSNNQIKKFKLIDNRVYFASSSVNQASAVANSAEAAPSYISLVTNLILNELIHLNLEKNMLNQFDHLFSLSFPLLSDLRFCNLSNSLHDLTTNQNQRPQLAINIEHNKWRCDCKTFELIDAIVSLLESNDTTDNFSSCYLKYLIKENNFIFANLANFTYDLNCFHKKTSHLWSSWYQTKCSNFSKFEFHKDFKIIENSNSSGNNNNSTKSTLISFKNNQIYSLGYHTTHFKFYYSTKTNLFKYDITNLFYWISSLCLSVITLSCLLLAWYYCWKKYKTTGVQNRRPHLANNNNREIARQTLNSRANTAHLSNRRNIYFQNSRQPSHQTHSGGTQARRDASYLYQIPFTSSNRDAEAATNSAENQERVNTETNETSPSLYYISLNQSSCFNGGRNFNLGPRAYINGGFLSRENDEPPNYYEAILVNNNRSLAKNSLNKNTSNQASRVDDLNELPSRNQDDSVSGAAISEDFTLSETSMERIHVRDVISDEQDENSRDRIDSTLNPIIGVNNELNTSIEESYFIGPDRNRGRSTDV